MSRPLLPCQRGPSSPSGPAGEMTMTVEFRSEVVRYISRRYKDAVERACAERSIACEVKEEIGDATTTAFQFRIEGDISAVMEVCAELQIQSTIWNDDGERNYLGWEPWEDRIAKGE